MFVGSSRVQFNAQHALNGGLLLDLTDILLTFFKNRMARVLFALTLQLDPHSSIPLFAMVMAICLVFSKPDAV